MFGFTQTVFLERFVINTRCDLLILMEILWYRTSAQTNVEGVVGPVTAITGSMSHDRLMDVFRRPAGGAQSADWGRDTSAINARASDQPS